MSQESRITPAQLAVLEQYTCQRLTAERGNREKTMGFFCSRNPSLACTLRDEAWYEDREGRPTVYYIVKNPQGQIVLYFSLKGGVLFDPNYVRDVMDRYDRTKALLDALEEREDSLDWAREQVERLRGGCRYVPSRKKRSIRMDFYHAREAKKFILEDEQAEPNEKMIRVDEAFPAIELVHFCVNDAARGQWANHRMGHPMGEVMFWYFVVPKMMEINRLIGCEYAYLFAADGTRDGNLINYYETALHFERMKHIGAIKPEYDFICVFMGKRLSRLTPYRRVSLELTPEEADDPLGLFDYREMFFEDFNLAPGVEPV